MDPTGEAPVKFETDDTVVILGKPTTKQRNAAVKSSQTALKLGVITTTFSDEEDSDSDDEETDRLKRGTVRVEWFPNGKEEVVETEKLSLLDRSLLVGELVAKRSDLTAVGYVKDCHITSDVVILPDKKFAITGVPAERLRFIKEFDDTATTGALLFDNWVGSLEETNVRLLLEFDGRYRFWLPSQQTCDLSDCTWKRDSYCTYDGHQFFVGQTVKGPMVMMKKVDWVSNRPTGKLQRNINNSSLKVVKFTVIEVEIESITVRWKYSLSETSKFPEDVVKKEDLEKVKKLDFFEYQYLQIGDRFSFTLDPKDQVVSYDDWNENFVFKCQQLISPEPVAKVSSSKRNVSPDEHSSNNSPETVGSPKKRKRKHSEVVDETTDDSIFTHPLVEVNDDVSPTLESSVVAKPTGRRHIGIVAKRGVRRLGSTLNASPNVKGVKVVRPATTTPKRNQLVQKTQETAQVVDAKGPGGSVENSFGSSVSPDNKVPMGAAVGMLLGKQVCVESILVVARLDVVWADGSMSTERAVDLAFASFDLDSHSFLPGAFVELKNIDGSNAQTTPVDVDKYGVVLNADSKERLVVVNWFQKELSSDAPPQLLSTESHSAYELVLHSFFHFFTGQVVFCASGTTAVPPEKPRVGQVLEVNAEGTVKVRWWYGEVENVYPQDVFPCDASDEEFATFGGNTTSNEDGPGAKLEEGEIPDSPESPGESAGDSDSSWETESEGSDFEGFEKKDLEGAESFGSRLKQITATLKLDEKRKETVEKLAAIMATVEQIQAGLEAGEAKHSMLAKVKACGVALKDLTSDFKTYGLWTEVANIVKFLEGYEKRFHVLEVFEKQLAVPKKQADPGCSSSVTPTSDAAEMPLPPPIVPALEDERSLTMVTTTEVGSIEVLPCVPINNDFFAKAAPLENPPKRFFAAVKAELKRLHTSLPHGIFVKSFEERMDLFSVMMIGPRETPFEDGIFIFDVKLKDSYPSEPPLVHYRSFSAEQLNPNLYPDGKVCVSLLGTWTGKSSEMWTAGSNLQQVFVSIQGLILNAEPYFNEAGYESRKALPESLEKSRRYNETALLQNLIALTRIASQLPDPFQKECERHLRTEVPRYVQLVENWISGGQVGFPLQPISQGFKVVCARVVASLKEALKPYSQ